MAEFKLGRIKFVWKGPFQASTPYYKDDVVLAGGVSYMCINAYTSSAAFVNDTVNWQQMAGGTKFVQTGWAASTAFNFGDLVTINGNVYYCNTAHTSPSTWLAGISNWTLYVPGVKFRGVWASGNVPYYINDLVKYGPDIYICTTANSNSTFTESNWSLFVQGLEYMNSWNSSTTYAIGDVVTYGGYVYSSKAINSNQTPSTATGYWDIVTTGYSQSGNWSLGTAYKTGNVVLFGGWSYVAVADSTNQQPYIGTTGINSTYWSLVVKGFNHRGAFAKALTVTNASGNGTTITLTFTTQSSTPFTIGTNITVSGVLPSTYNGVYVVTGGSTTTVTFAGTVTTTFQASSGTVAGIYYPGDVVLNTSSTYVATAVSSNVFPPNAVYWQIIGQGGVGASLTEVGDLAYRYSDGTVTGLHMATGTQAGGNVIDGYVLKAKTQSDTTMQPRWGELGYINNIWYVSASTGTDASGFGRTLDKPFASIRYACLNVTGPATIYVKTGSYYETLPISVPANVSLVGDELRTTMVYPAAGTSADGVTPNNRSRMFMVNNGVVIRNMTLGGLTGQFTGAPYLASDNYDTDGIYRLTVGTWPSLTASGAYIALDPAGAITTKSPYIQNCSTFGDHAVGMYINGADQASGNKSMVSNDFTQVIDDGIGIMASNGGRGELVSVFTYYAYIGYLAQTGGVLRATNGNNSYGRFGDVATDTDPTDTGYSGTVNNLANSAKIGNVLVGNGQILAILWDYCGQAYTSPTIALDNAPLNGTNASVSGVITNNALSHVNVTNVGSGYQYVAGTGRNGGVSSSGTWFALAATDKATANNQYQGMRITIINGLGAGQTGVITNSYLTDTPSGTTKVVYVQTTAGADGWETLVTGATIVTTLDASSQYTILPEVRVIGGGYTTQALVRANIDPATFTFTGVYILNGGAGYTGTPTYTITDPQGTGAAFTSQILSGAISSVTYANRGAGYVVIYTTTTSITDSTGYANIAQTGFVINLQGLNQAPRVGSIIVIQGQASAFLVVQTNSYISSGGKANVTIGSAVSTLTPLTHGATVTIYAKFSQVRLTGHDYLAIGTGNFASTAYPNVLPNNYKINNQHVSQNNGRIFYTSTDQDGNFSVGDLFKINQATGQATLNVSSFNLAGLNSLQLGNAGAIISQFSTDGTLSANSDSIVPTQKAVRSYISSQLGSGSNNLQVNVLTAGKVYIQNNIISSSPGTASDIVFAPDGAGKVQFNSVTNYNFTTAQINTQTYTALANKDYVDQGNRETIHSLTVDTNGNLLWTSDIGSTGATLDASAYQDFTYLTRGSALLINNSTGNLQITY
jgi:hypothetical protein